MFFLGLLLVIGTLRMMKRAAGPEEERKTADLSSEEEGRLESALKQLEEEEEPVF